MTLKAVTIRPILIRICSFVPPEDNIIIMCVELEVEPLLLRKFRRLNVSYIRVALIEFHRVEFYRYYKGIYIGEEGLIHT